MRIAPGFLLTVEWYGRASGGVALRGGMFSGRPAGCAQPRARPLKGIAPSVDRAGAKRL